MAKDIAIPSYVVNAAVIGPSGGGPGGSNKPMVSVLNPAGSERLCKLRALLVQPESSTGTDLIVLYELRRFVAHSAGTSYTPIKRDKQDPASVVEAKTESTIDTYDADIGTKNIHSFILQSNTVQGVYIHPFGLHHEQPIIFRPGEGLVAFQVTSNGGTFHITMVWTEEKI